VSCAFPRNDITLLQQLAEVSSENYYGQVVAKYFTVALGPRKIAALHNDVQLPLHRQKSLYIPCSRCATIDFFLSAEFSLD